MDLLSKPQRPLEEGTFYRYLYDIEDLISSIENTHPEEVMTISRLRDAREYIYASARQELGK